MLRALELSDMEPIRIWRNQHLDILRTPFALTKEQQEDWYKNEICNRQSKSRFWAVVKNTYKLDGKIVGDCVGYGGIENIQWENSLGEISLLIGPEYQGKGYGIKAAKEILRKAFQELNLKTVYAECYENNKATKFWDKVFNGCFQTILPNRKYYNGVYFNSIYYSMDAKDFV